MSFHGQSVLPAVRDMKQLEKFLASNYEYGVLLDNQVGMLKGIMKEVHKHEKKANYSFRLNSWLKAR
ncbi:Glycerol uptake operon antiterminator regulatory protein [Priestia megaterium WSH-002]|uniref:Glycerol uptake operon antiterminator regulatory protein n=1 Tax=Priestia megaterium (strain WSH-002) TaxID=1006007 RepID=A0A8D4BMJ6_PRIMW|nr:Glycerol uptake operon antiterminator regulatory protein [Priestia megaterium WSH-002]